MNICDACVFAEWVKEAHRLPLDAETMLHLNVCNVLFVKGTGHYCASSFDFDDDSSYWRGKVQCGCGGNA